MSYFQFYQPFTGVVRHLVIINVLMYFGAGLLLGEKSVDLDTYQYISLGRLQLAAFLPGSMYYQPFQLVTHMFMHEGIGHLAFNMLALYFFGTSVEMAWGHRRFLFYYLVCGLGALAFYMSIEFWQLTRAGIDTAHWIGCMWGASGAIFGVLVAFALTFPNQTIQLIFPPVAIKAKYFVLFIAILEWYYGVEGSMSGVAHFAHFGGAITGILLVTYWNRRHLF